MSRFRLAQVLIISMMLALVLFAADRPQQSFSAAHNGTSLANTLFVQTGSAWAGCPDKYSFSVDNHGNVFLTSSVPESAQDANVFIDGVFVKKVSAPGPSGDGTPILIGTVSLTDGHHTWQVVGLADGNCTNSGDLNHDGKHTDTPPAGGGQCIAYEANLPEGKYTGFWVETPKNREANAWLVVDTKNELLINYDTGDFHTGDLQINDDQGNKVGLVHVDQPSNACTWLDRTPPTATQNPVSAALEVRHSVNPGGLWDPVFDTTGYLFSDIKLLSPGRLLGPGTVFASGAVLGTGCILVEGERGDIVLQVGTQTVTVPVSTTFSSTHLADWPCLVDKEHKMVIIVAGMSVDDIASAIGVKGPNIVKARNAFYAENQTDGVQDGKQYSYAAMLAFVEPAN